MRETGLADVKDIDDLLIEKINYKKLKEYLEKCKGRVILPIGSIEPHADVFPLGTDKIIARNLSIELAKELYRQGKCALIAPVLSYGISIEWKKSNATITFSPLTMFLVLNDILYSLRKDGFKEIIILNAHGGNSEIIRLVAREFVEEYDDIKIIVIDWWKTVNDIISSRASAKTFMHSDEIEISMLLYWNIIDKSIIKERIINKNKLPWIKGNGIEVYSSVTKEQALVAYGDPSRASVELGEYLVKTFCKRVANIIE